MLRFNKSLLHLSFRIGIELAVVDEVLLFLHVEKRGELFDACDKVEIDNYTALRFFNEIVYGVEFIAFIYEIHYPEREVGTADALVEHLYFIGGNPRFSYNVRLDLACRRCRQRYRYWVSQHGSDLLYAGIIRPEIVAPLADTVSLVDCEE